MSVDFATIVVTVGVIVIVFLDPVFSSCLESRHDLSRLRLPLTRFSMLHVCSYTRRSLCTFDSLTLLSNTLFKGVTLLYCPGLSHFKEGGGEGVTSQVECHCLWMLLNKQLDCITLSRKDYI